MAAKCEQKSAVFYHYCEVSRSDEAVQGKCKVWKTWCNSYEGKNGRWLLAKLASCCC